MKILIVSQYFYPEQFQINEIAPELVRRGHDITVLCSMPNYPKGEYFAGYETLEGCKLQDADYQIETGVKIIRVFQIPRGRNVIGLVRNYLSFAWNSLRSVKSLPEDFDVVLGYQLSPILSMCAALRYKQLHKTPVLFYTLDQWPISAASMLKGTKNPLYWFVKLLSKKIYKNADRILVTSRPFIDYLSMENKVELERFRYLPQHAGQEMINLNLMSENNCVADFMFAGNFGRGQWLDVIIKAAAELGPRNDYKIHMVGDGSMRKELEKLVSDTGLLENFVFYGNQKREDMPEYYKKADVLIITLRGNNEVGNTMPGKLQMYMTTGKPIIGAINGATQEILSEAKCGECVPAGDYKGLARLMLKYIENPDLYMDPSIGENARNYFRKHFTLEKFMEGLCMELEELVNYKK